MQRFLLASLAAAAAVAGPSVAAQAPGQGAAQRVLERAEVTRPQAQDRAARMIDRSDANKDGQLDQADRAERQRARFDRLDSDSDGAISFAEFNTMRERAVEPRAKQRGVEPRAERPAPRTPRAGPMAMGRRADMDGDGKISRDEFTSGALAQFDRADADRDGTLTAEERRGARRPFRGMGRGPAAG